MRSRIFRNHGFAELASSCLVALLTLGPLVSILLQRQILFFYFYPMYLGGGTLFAETPEIFSKHLLEWRSPGMPAEIFLVKKCFSPLSFDGINARVLQSQHCEHTGKPCFSRLLEAMAEAARAGHCQRPAPWSLVLTKYEWHRDHGEPIPAPPVRSALVGRVPL